MRNYTVLILIVFILLIEHLKIDAASSISNSIPANLAIAPLKVSSNANIELRAINQKNIALKFPGILSKEIEKHIREKRFFSKVVSISEQVLPSSASISEIAQAGRDIKADVVLESKILEFDGKIDYGFRTSLREYMVVELVLYETNTGLRLWHGRESVNLERYVPINSWSDEMVENKYIAIAEKEILPAILAVLLPKLHEDMAGYKPPATDKLVAAAAEFVADVDRVPRSLTEVKNNAYAVIIGIEAYRDLPIAEFTVRDAKIMKEYLVRVMGFPPENIVTLLNERATKGDIEGYIGTWLKNNVERNSLVFIFYAGHGAPNPITGEAFIIPFDGNPAFLEASAIPLKKLFQMLNGLQAKDVLMVMDSCFSGAGGRSVMAKGGRPIAVSIENPFLATNNIVMLSAAKGTEISSSYPEKRHGLFTYFLLKGLQGEADINGDTTISLEELYNYITPNVKNIARENNREQTPLIMPDFEMMGNRANLPLCRVSK